MAQSLIARWLPMILVMASFAEAREFSAHQIMIVGPSRIAQEAGLTVHFNKGNIVDVAVATGLALGVTTPYYAGFGGGGFALLKPTDAEVLALDFRETAPKELSPQVFVENSQAARTGGLAVATPGLIAGYFELHRRYGKLPWAQVVQPALALAKNGFPVSGEWVNQTFRVAAELSSGGRRHLQLGRLWRPGEILVQKGLAQFLEKLSKNGAAAFYEGDVAQDLVATVRKSKGILSLDDLKNYRPKWRKPLQWQHRELSFFWLPLPSSGGLIVGPALQLVTDLKLDQHPEYSVDELAQLARVLRLGFADRVQWGDGLDTEVIFKKRMQKSNLKKWRRQIESGESAGELKRSKHSGHSTAGPESDETTHFSVMNHLGEGISVTVTLNGNYGSKLITEKYGIALNNEIDDFSTVLNAPNQFMLQQGTNNQVKPGMRPLSSMTPTLVVSNNEVIAAVGAPGGPRIVSAVFQTLYRLFWRGAGLERAVQGPRVHHQYQPDIIYYDEHLLQPATLLGLKKRLGIPLEPSWIAKSYAIIRGVTTKTPKRDHLVWSPSGFRMNADQTGQSKAVILEGAYDHRGDGAAVGL